MDLKHELICALKQLAQELGTTPTRDQFKKLSQYGTRYETAFGPWNQFVEAAGLAPNIVRAKKMTNEIFKVDITNHLKQHIPTEIKPKQIWPKIAILGDLHEPFGHEKVKSEFVLFCEKFQPDWIVQVGDGLDMYSHSSFPKSQNIFTPKHEEEAGVKNLRELWSELNKVSPNSKKVMLMGNHTIRPLKLVLQHAPSIEHWAEKYLADLLTFDGVTAILDPRQEFVIADIAFIHGHLSQLGGHRDYMLMNAVRGHDHVGGCVFRQIHGRTLFELDAGLAGDYEAKIFNYTPQKMTKWTLGWASIDSLGPRFIPL